MRLQALVLAAAIVTVTAAAVLSRDEPQRRRKPAAPIPLKELHDRGVAGRLGPKMGTIVEVTGVVVENTSKAKADTSEPFFLRIDSVDGRKLESSELFSSSAMELLREVPALKVGDRFKCVGYERGGFRGSPDGEFEYVPARATQGFFFHVEFIVLKAA